MPAEQVSHGPFAVDLAARVVLRDGEPLPVGQRGAMILGALLRRPGEILTKSELLDAAWGGSAVEESNLSVQVAALRKALGRTADGGDWIATIPRVGYRLVGAASRAHAAAATPAQPALMVMPFESLTAVPEGMSEGLREQVLVALASTPDILVLGRRIFADDPVDDPCALAADLGASHVLVGSLRADAGRVRVSARLLDSGSGAATWAESWQRDLADPFAVEEEVARLMAAGVRRAVVPGSAIGEVFRVPTTPEAAAHYVRGAAMLYGQTQNETIFHRMVEKFERVVALEPGFAPATAALAEVHFLNASNGWHGDPRDAIQLARTLADRAIETDTTDPYAHSVSCLVALGERDLQRAGDEAAFALRLDANDPIALAVQGNVFIARGRPLEAIESLERSMRIASASHQYPLHHLALAYLCAGRSETAAALLRERILLVPGTDMSRGYLAAVLCELGEVEEARLVWSELMAINPDWSLAQRLEKGMLSIPDEVGRRLVAALRSAGIEA